MLNGRTEPREYRYGATSEGENGRGFGRYAWIDDYLETPVGPVPRIKTALTLADRAGAWKVRWAVGRKNYRVEPGLYAVSAPNGDSPVLVTANYKLSFDRLRSELGGIDAWILALDTKGINVWCAAGKGTFGTDELVRRVKAVGLGEVVSHRTLVLPQLAAPGVAAHKVKRLSGFRVVYGPVYAKDLPAFLNAGMDATPAMRRVHFRLWDRLVLIPAELVGSAKFFLPVAAAFFLLSGLGAGGYSGGRISVAGIPSVVLFSAAYFGGAAVTPALLPWLPGRAFSGKGAWVGLAASVALVAYWLFFGRPFVRGFDLAPWVFLMPAVSSFVGMNFTGSSTYTSLSGVKREMRFAVPLQITAGALGVGLWVIGLFV